VHFPPCILTGRAADPIVEGAGENELAVTFTPASAILNLDDDFAPNAAIITFDKCDVIGRGTILSIRGKYAAGFQGYYGVRLVPANIEGDWQHYVAVRWVDRKLELLGEGVALSVNSHGVCVGYHTISTENKNGCSACPPSVTWRAVLWRQDGSPSVLESNLNSAAYAVDDDGRVVGMVQDSAGRHFAFLWHGGELKRLDDLVKAPRWRFESAYGFTPDGGILGIGTHDGVAAAFIVHL
jgi:probable HAF family extracellular repeat protein